ncbi:MULTISPECIES: dermonecrotic toxin domain-containing protein [Pseudomonas]
MITTAPVSVSVPPLDQPKTASTPDVTAPAHPTPRQKTPNRRNHHESLIPGLPYNKQVDKFVTTATADFKTPSQSTADIIRAELKKRWGKDIDPDNTFITTLNYDPKKPKPTGGKVLNQISLTQAALHNAQRANKNDEHQTPDEKQRSTLHTWLQRLAPLAPLPAVIDAIDTKVHEQKTYEGIFIGADPDRHQFYNERTLLPHTPAAFRDIVWNTELKQPYTEFLDRFWPAHEQKYAQTAKASFIGAALAQFNNDSLSEHATNLIMRAAGVPENTTWSSLTLDNLKAPHAKDPNLEIGLLKINGFQATDLLYITDKTTKIGADGKPGNPTLLYIPGNSSPIHSFDSPAQMKNWLAEQAADPVKREALSMHFKMRDQANRFFSEGVNQALVGISGWSKKDAPDASITERLNEYDPQTLITTEPLSEDPFKVIAQRQKERSYADAETEITTDGDVTKATILEVLETTTKIALMLTPLTLVMPEVAVALEVFYAAAGAAEAGIGADDLKHGKPGGADHIVFGVLNALPALASGASKAIKGVTAGETAVGKSLKESVLANSEIPASAEVGEAIANRIQPSQAANISAHAVPDSARILERAMVNTKGIYQYKDAAEVDHWYIQYKDATGVSRLYEIKSDFKLSNDYVQIIDPATRKPVQTVHAVGDGQWAAIKGDGGIWPWKRPSSPTPSIDPKLPPQIADHFLELNGAKMKGAEKLDEYLRLDANYPYTYGVAVTENAEVVPQISWTSAENPAHATAPPEANNLDFGANPYSDLFIVDMNRSKLTLQKPDGSILESDTGADITAFELQNGRLASDDEIIAIKKRNIEAIEKFIPDPELRARISQVSNQWLLGSGPDEFQTPRLKGGIFASGRDPHYFVYFDPTNKVTTVTGKSDIILSKLDGREIETVTDIQAKSSKTVTISASNELGSGGYVIEPYAPTRIEITPKLD